MFLYIAGQLELYKPKRFTIEPPVDVSQGKNISLRVIRQRSRNYSLQRAVELKCSYEKEMDFTYDYVMVSRFDLMLLKDIKLETFNSELFYVPNYAVIPGMKTRQVPRWTVPPKINVSKKKHMLHDIYFISGSEMMDSFIFGATEVKYLEETGNVHKLLWARAASTIGLKKVRYYGWRGYDFDLYRWRVNHCAI